MDQLPQRLLRMVVGLQTPAEVLSAVEAGADLITTPYPFLLARTGKALTFSISTLEEEDSHSSGNGGPHKKRRRAAEEAPEEGALEGSPGQEGDDEEKEGLINLWERRWRTDPNPLLSGCACPACRRHSRAYIHHLLLAHEMLAEILLYCHNLTHYLALFQAARAAVPVPGALQRLRASLEAYEDLQPTSTSAAATPTPSEDVMDEEDQQ